MKPIRVPMTDYSGNRHYWTISREPRVSWVGRWPDKPRKLSGWSFVDHDGYKRWAGENWAETVQTVRLIASNYALETTLS